MKKYLIAAASVATLAALSAQAQALSLKIGGGCVTQIGPGIKIGSEVLPSEVLCGIPCF